MNDEDMERWLRENPAGPGPGVEHRVLRGYEAVYGRRRFWSRPVPLYQAAAGLLVVAGMALAAGRLTAPDPELPPAVAGATTASVSWTSAPGDVIHPVEANAR